MSANAPLRHSEYLRLPCEVAPSERQGRAADISDMAMVLTVERCYPGEIDEALEAEGYDSLSITRFIQDKYTDALLDFGFAQARGLELGMLGRSALHCDRKAGNTCDACPINSLYEDFSERIAALKNLAATHGISEEVFMRMYHLAVEAANAIPEAYEVHDAVDDALELFTQIKK